MIHGNSEMAAAMALTKAAQDGQQKKQEDSTNSGAADALEVIGGVIDGTDIAASACKAAVTALQPKFSTGGGAEPATFVTGGGDGAANTFATVADCTPTGEVVAETAEVGSSLLGFASDAGGAIVEGVGTVLGGIFEGLGSL